MSFDGNGNYTVPAGTAAVTGAVIDSTLYNALLADLQTALTKAFLRDGQSAALANLPMGGFKLTGLAAGTTAGNSVRYEQVGALALAQQSAPVTVRAYNSASTAMTNNVLTKIDFQTEEEDTTGVFASSRLTATVAGDYLITANYTPGAASLACFASVYKNGSRHKDGSIVADLSGGVAVSASVNTLVYLAVADYIEICGYQNSGGPQGTATGANSTWFAATLIHRR